MKMLLFFQNDNKSVHYNYDTNCSLYRIQNCNIVHNRNITFYASPTRKFT